LAIHKCSHVAILSPVHEEVALRSSIS
jgi:hypothetical protein